MAIREEFMHFRWENHVRYFWGTVASCAAGAARVRRAIGTTPQLAQRLLFCNSDLDKSITAPSFVGYIDLPKRLECPASSRDRLCCD